VSGADVLIIGGGFLGRALALRLVADKCRVVVLTPHAEATAWPQGIAIVRGRQEDKELVSKLLSGCRTVVHAAWGTTPASSESRPSVEAVGGLTPFLAFLETLQRFPETRLLFLSSGGTVYGDPDHLPVTEDAPFRPRSCHGTGKVAAELFLGISGLRSAILRPSNIYGPGQVLRSGFGVIRHLLYCASANIPFQLVGDGSQLRDYLFVEDFVDAAQRLLKHENVVGIFNVGSGVGVSLSELIDQVGHVTARSIRVEMQSARVGDVSRIVLDITRIRDTVGWVPVTNLESGIANFWRSIKKMQ